MAWIFSVCIWCKNVGENPSSALEITELLGPLCANVMSHCYIPRTPKNHQDILNRTTARIVVLLNDHSGSRIDRRLQESTQEGHTETPVIIKAALGEDRDR